MTCCWFLGNCRQQSNSLSIANTICMQPPLSLSLSQVYICVCPAICRTSYISQREIDQREKMSNEEIEEKQYKYARKYKKMVKQFDELIDIVDSLTSKLRRGKNPRERKSARPVEASKSKAAAAAAATTADQTRGEEKSSSNPAGMILNQEENDHNLLVQTVTRHLEDLRDDSP